VEIREPLVRRAGALAERQGPMSSRTQPSPDRLARAERRVLRDLADVSRISGVDYADILDYDKDARRWVLQRMRNQLVRGFVVFQYTLVDDWS
jgi:hypothetical protein